MIYFITDSHLLFTFIIIMRLELQYHKYPFCYPTSTMISACPHSTYMQGIGCSEMNISTAKKQPQCPKCSGQLLLKEATAMINSSKNVSSQRNRSQLLVPRSIRSPNAENTRINRKDSKDQPIARIHRFTSPYPSK